LPVGSNILAGTVADDRANGTTRLTMVGDNKVGYNKICENFFNVLIGLKHPFDLEKLINWHVVGNVDIAIFMKIYFGVGFSI